MIENYKIRKAIESDLPRLCDIYNQAIRSKRCTCDTEQFAVEQRKGWFLEHNNDKYPLYVITIDDVVVGYSTLSAYRPGRKAVAHVAEVSYYLDFNYQGRKLGTKLLEFMLIEAKKCEISVLIAILLSGNLASINLLKKYGFEQWGVLPQIANLDNVIFDHLYFGKKF